MYRIHGVTPQTYAPTMETAIAFTHPDDLERVEAAVANAIHAARPFEFSARLISAQGVLRHVNCRGVTRLEVDGRVGMVVGVVADLTAQRETERALREANRQLEALANVDSLTGIANRRRFDEILALEWRRAERERMPLSLVMLDIDRFKGFNDRYGHLAGDECLRRVAGVLAERGRRAADIAARYGGEEMVLLLPATTASGAEIIARECRSAIAALGISHEGNMSCGGVVTASFGVATAILPDESGFPACTDLVAEADRQLYEAKRTGRNKVMTPQTAVSDGASLLPPDEERRLAELARYEATGAGRRTQEMDGIARLAATLSGTPIALVSLVTRDLKLFIGNFNVPGTDSLPRDISFCQHTILGDEPMVVADATRDMRFKENPLVTGDFGLRYYAGAPIVSQGTGHKLGTLCVVDTVARERTSVAERAVLTDLAAMVAALLEDNLKSAEG
jgi:diguanylate cyclase (GGDEF)-like protein